MDTQPPTPSSLSETDLMPPELVALHKTLSESGVEVEAIAVLILSQNEMVFGEVHNLDAFRADPIDGVNAGLGPILGKTNVVALKNPKRLTRFNVQGPQGQVGTQLLFSDFDLISEGTVEFIPTGAFFLTWLNYTSQFAYCNAFIKFMEGKALAKAKAAGIHIAGPGDVPPMRRV